MAEEKMDKSLIYTKVKFPKFKIFDKKYIAKLLKEQILYVMKVSDFNKR